MTVNDLIHTAAWLTNKLRLVEEQRDHFQALNAELREQLAEAQAKAAESAPAS